VDASRRQLEAVDSFTLFCSFGGNLCHVPSLCSCYLFYHAIYHVVYYLVFIFRYSLYR